MLNVGLIAALQVCGIAAIWVFIYKIWNEISTVDAIIDVCVGMLASRAVLWEIAIVAAAFVKPVQVVVHFLLWISVGVAIFVVLDKLLHIIIK